MSKPTAKPFKRYIWIFLTGILCLPPLWHFSIWRAGRWEFVMQAERSHRWVEYLVERGQVLSWNYMGFSMFLALACSTIAFRRTDIPIKWRMGLMVVVLLGLTALIYGRLFDGIVEG